MDKKELALIQAGQAGDAEAFGQLYDKYFKQIYSFVYYKISHHPTTEDLVADIFTKALDKFARYDSNKGKFSSWLYRIARNTVIDHYRRQPATSDIDLKNISDTANQDEHLDNQAKLAEIKTKLAELNETQQEIIILRVWQGLSYREIAEIVDKSEANCKVIFSRGIKELRLSLSGWLILISVLINQNYG